MAYPIVITSPIERDIIVKGTTKNITWKYVETTATPVDIKLYRYEIATPTVPARNLFVQNIVLNIPIGVGGNGSYSWNVPSDLIDRTTYMIFIKQASTNVTLGWTYSFDIVTSELPCTPVWVCEQPLNGYEIDGCGNRGLNSRCNSIIIPPSPISSKIISGPTGSKKPKEFLIENINNAKALGFDVYVGHLIRTDIAGYRNNTMVDYHLAAIQYANSIGMKTSWSLNPGEYDLTYNLVYDNPITVTKYINDVDFVVNRYKNIPGFIGIYLHEIYYHNSLPSDTIRRRDIINNIFVRVRQIVDNAGVQPNFKIMAGCFSNTRCGVGGHEGMGTDSSYISNNFNTPGVCVDYPHNITQNALNKPLVDLFTVGYGRRVLWEGLLPNIEVIETLFITVSSLLATTLCKNFLANPKIIPNDPTACLNQLFFDQLSEISAANRSYGVFALGLHLYSNTYWNSYNNTTYPGNGTGEKIQNILIGITPTPTTPTPTPTSTPVPDTFSIDIVSIPAGAEIIVDGSSVKVDRLNLIGRLLLNMRKSP